MPIVGKKSSFAVEYELDVDHEGEWLLGRFCYWCGGEQLGRYDVSVSLRDVLFALERIEFDANKRANQRFEAMSTKQVFDMLNGALFVGGSPEWENIANEEQWARHKVVPSMSIFNRLRGFLVEGKDADRLIIARLPEGAIQECLLKPGELDAVLSETVRELDHLLKDAAKSM